MKAVVWTDTFQICIMLAGILAAIIQVSLSDFKQTIAVLYDNSSVFLFRAASWWEALTMFGGFPRKEVE